MWIEIMKSNEIQHDEEEEEEYAANSIGLKPHIAVQTLNDTYVCTY